MKDKCVCVCVCVCFSFWSKNLCENGLKNQTNLPIRPGVVKGQTRIN